jgi:hypothetical protein
MYRVLVFYPGGQAPHKTLRFDNAAAVLEAIPQALEDPSGCERLEVFLGVTRLFKVDCHGNTTAG